MSGLFGNTPTPPNPLQTAAASTSTNVATGVANAFLNNVNQNTPEGALRYDVTSNYNWNDPYTGQNLSIPQFTATQSLSPFGQELQGYQQGAQRNLGQAAVTGAGRVNQLMQGANPLTGAPDAGNIGWLRDIPHQQMTLGNVGEQQRTLTDEGNVNRGRAEEALFGRLNPQLERERGNIEQRLADQGIRYGSEAYTRAMDDYSRQANDARLAVTVAGKGEQEQAFQQALQTGTFANQAQKDAFQQEAIRGEFYNAGIQQWQARNQNIFNNQNQLRSQALNEQYAQRNQQFNEITALMSGSQVSSPSFVSTNQNNINTTDIAGLINNRFSQDMDTYKQQSANFNSLMGGIFGAMGGMVKSDRREKEDIEKVGTIFAAGPDSDKKELPIYEYSYKDDDPDGRRHVGPMAQDVEKIDKRAVQTRKGVKYINTTRMGSIMKVA
ncbi:MAG TPA: tail fiber domain-containing protein [Povalibacter sp.]